MYGGWWKNGYPNSPGLEADGREGLLGPQRRPDYLSCAGIIQPNPFMHSGVYELLWFDSVHMTPWRHPGGAVLDPNRTSVHPRDQRVDHCIINNARDLSTNHSESEELTSLLVLLGFPRSRARHRDPGTCQ